NLFIELWMMIHIIVSIIQKKVEYKWIGYLFGFLLTISMNQLFYIEKLKVALKGKKYIWIRFIPFIIIIIISFITSYFKKKFYIILLSLLIPLYIISNMWVILLLLKVIDLIDK